MKALFYIFSGFILCSIPLAVMNCDDTIPSGLVTTIHGQVWDSVKHEPMDSVNVVVWACNTIISDWDTRDCDIVVDSVRTDAKGRYLIEFTTAGQADQYWIMVERSDLVLTTEEKKVRPGISSFITIYARELNLIKVRLQIKNNSVGPIHLRTIDGLNELLISRQTRDTVVYGKVFPKAVNHIRFSVFDPSIGNAARTIEDSLTIGIIDTTYVVKTITDPAEWPVGM